MLSKHEQEILNDIRDGKHIVCLHILGQDLVNSMCRIIKELDRQNTELCKIIKEDNEKHIPE